MNRIWKAGVLAAAVLWFGANPAAAQQKRQDLKATAVQIAEEATALAKGGQVRLGNFVPVGPVFDGGDGLPALELELKGAFGATLNQKASIEVRGELRYTSVENVEGKVVNIKALVENLDNNKILKEIEIPILYVADIGRMTGPIGGISPKGSAGDARKEIEKLLADPKPDVSAGTLISSAKGGSYQVEIRAKKNGAAGAPVARGARVEGGLPFVKIDAAEVYEVRVLNNSTQEAAVTLAIDGLDQFSFTENRTKGTSDSSHYTTKFGDGNILNKPRAKVGMIELQFSHSFVEDKDAKTRGDVETSKGKVGEVSGTVVKRFINPAEDFITIRYNREIK
jgi:hypothetical protein